MGIQINSLLLIHQGRQLSDSVIAQLLVLAYH